jgi:hypothetical protein
MKGSLMFRNLLIQRQAGRSRSEGVMLLKSNRFLPHAWRFGADCAIVHGAGGDMNATAHFG